MYICYLIYALITKLPFPLKFYKYFYIFAKKAQLGPTNILFGLSYINIS